MSQAQEQPRKARHPRSPVPARLSGSTAPQPKTAQDRTEALQSPVTGKPAPRPTPEALGLHMGPKGLRTAIAPTQSPPYAERPGLLVDELPKLLVANCGLRNWQATLDLSEYELIAEVQCGLLRKSWMTGSQWDPDRASYSMWTIMAAKSILSNLYRSKRILGRREIPMPTDAEGEAIELQFELPAESDLESNLREWAADCILAMDAEEVEEWISECKAGKAKPRPRRGTIASTRLNALVAWRAALTRILEGESRVKLRSDTCNRNWDNFVEWLEEHGVEPWKYRLPF